MIKNKLKYSLIILASLFAMACSSYDEDISLNFTDNEIFGNWADTVQLQPCGYLVYSLVFRPNGSFEANNDIYGLYADQAKDSISSYQHDSGSYVPTTKNITFVSKQSINWDLMANKLPETTVKDTTLFQSCTYKIEKNTLELKYIETQDKQEKQIIRIYRKVRDIL